MRLRKKLVPALFPVFAGVLAAVLPLLSSPPLAAQATPITTFGIEKGQVPAMEIGVGYVYLHANAPPALCGCFSLNGGSLTWVINMNHGISMVADFTGAQANHVNATDQNIGIFDFLFGGRYTMRKHKIQPFAQALVGGSNEISNYTYVSNVTALAFSGGGGISTTLNRHIGINIIEADYIHSRLPNGAVNNTQNDLRLRTGIVFRFGPR